MSRCTSRFVPRRSDRHDIDRLARQLGRGGPMMALEPLEARALFTFAWSSSEVYLAELVNRARANPAAEATRLGLNLTAGLTAGELARYGPQEPLALNQYLTTASRAHSLDMGTRNFFDHTNPSGQTPTDRVQAAGYGGTAGENIAAGYASVDLAHRGWMASLGHRKNVLSLHSSFDSTFHYDEFGAGIALNTSGTYGNYYTENFGYPGATHVQYVLGVAFNDTDNNDFYGIGEGASGIRIDVALQSSPGTVVGTYTTDAAGNYQIPIGDGAYTVTFTRIGDGFTYSRTATLNGQNVKVDVQSSELVDPTPPPPPPPDDFAGAGEWAQAGGILVDQTNGNAAKVGAIEFGGDTDLFAYVASQTGAATITLSHPAGLFGMQLTVFNSLRQQIAVGVAGAPAGNGSSATIDVVAGQTYFLLAAAVSGSATGQYIIAIEGPGVPPPPPPPPDDYADIGEWGSAATIVVNGSTGNGSITGDLEVGGDTDLFVFTATRTGRVTLTLANGSGAFAAQFTAYDSSFLQVALGTVGGANNNGSTGQFNVSAGMVYYVLAAAVDALTTGTYVLVMAGPSAVALPDDAADAGEWTMASTLSLNGDAGSAFRAGYFENAGDTDLFRFSATRTGRARITLQHPLGEYAVEVRLYAADRSLVGIGLAGGPQDNGSILEFEITLGLTYFVLAAPVDGEAIGLYTLDMSSLDPSPVAVNNGVLATRQQPVASMLIDGRLTLAFVNLWGQPLIATQQSSGAWTYQDLLAAAPTVTGVSGELGQWVDTRDHRTYIAMRSVTGLILFRENTPGNWSFRNLTDELRNAQLVSADLSVFMDAQGRANIAATSSAGDVIVYSQTIKRTNDGQWRWKYRNLTHNDLEVVGQEAPYITSELVTWVTSLGVANIAFIDLDGDIRVMYKGKLDSRWTLGNLSEAAGTAPLVGELSVIQMRNRTVQISGTTEEGNVWVTTFREGNGWSSRDLTDRLDGPTMRVRALTSFVNKAGMGFVAGIKENGQISLFRYQASKNRWAKQDLGLAPPDSRQMAGRLETVVDLETGEVNIVGTLDSTRLVRWTWQPGQAWSYQDVSYRLAGG